MYGISFRWTDIVDVAIVAAALYYILIWLRGTRAVQLIRGLLFLIFIWAVGRALDLRIINWLFDKFSTVILVLLIIVFQPELRRALERIGRARLLVRMGLIPEPRGGWLVKHLMKAVETLSERRTGAIIALERNTGLSEFLESGVKLDAVISAELLLALFSTKSPMHDGAVIIQGDRISAAGCLLPLSETRIIDKRHGTRHRAAIGLTEQTDAFAIVVSERAGTVSVAENGYLTRSVTGEMLEEKLFSLFRVAGKSAKDKK